ncbi:MAG TPA: hypothetical protein VFN67_23355 [Polyangiales bacterium]|nr:hypothetical protein [Polyangiales bacterium]
MNTARSRAPHDELEVDRSAERCNLGRHTLYQRIRAEGARALTG